MTSLTCTLSLKLQIITFAGHMALKDLYNLARSHHQRHRLENTAIKLDLVTGESYCVDGCEVKTRDQLILIQRPALLLKYQLHCLLHILHHKGGLCQTGVKAKVSVTVETALLCNRVGRVRRQLLLVPAVHTCAHQHGVAGLW